MKLIKFDVDNIASEPVNVQKIFEGDIGKEIRISMQTGGAMPEHKAPRPITILVLKGTVLIGSSGEEVVLGCGDMVAFGANELHSLLAKEPSVLRLTLSNEDGFERVQGVTAI